VAVIRIEGVIMKEDNCGAPGTETLSKIVKEAYAHPNIAAIVIIADSGGGAVNGTFEFSDLLTNGPKWVVTHVTGMAGSAMYAIASGTHIIASHRTVEVGSIGTAISFMDYTKAYEEMGIKEHYINATASKDKNQDYFEALKGNYDRIRKNILDPTNDVFLDTVKNNRAGKLDLKEEDVLTGKMYLAEAAIENGLIDEIGDFEYAIDTALKLAEKEKPTTGKSTSNLNNQSKEDMKLFGNNKFPKAVAAFSAGKDGGEMTSEQLTAANEELQAAKVPAAIISEAEYNDINAKLENIEQLEANNATLTQAKATAENALTTATAEVATLKADKATAATALTAMTTERDEWKTKAVEYGAQDGDTHSNPKKENEKVDDTEDPMKAIDELPHNKLVDGSI
jgi:ClpP class serine protease